MIIAVMFDGDSSRGGACSVHGDNMTQRRTTAAGGCGELRWGSPRRLPATTQWITYNAVERTASQPTGSLGEGGVRGGWLAVAHFLRWAI